MKLPWICYWDIIWISFCIFLQITFGCSKMKFHCLGLQHGPRREVTSAKLRLSKTTNEPSEVFWLPSGRRSKKSCSRRKALFKKSSTRNLFVVTLSVILHHFDLYPELLLKANLNQIWNKAPLGKTLVNFYNKKTEFRFNGK